MVLSGLIGLTTTTTHKTKVEYLRRFRYAINPEFEFQTAAENAM
jgi:hypothetical protein